MKIVILAGGLGTRLSEETASKPKPLVKIGDMPILWHIMKIYSHYGFNDFIICCGYKGYLIKEFFANYYLHTSDISINLSSGRVEVINKKAEPWRVTLIDTGENTMTGGRLKRIERHLEGDTFMATYGDGLSNIDISKLYEFHKSHGRLATLSAVSPPGRFGALTIDESDYINEFLEKPEGDGGLINGGFFVFNREFLNTIEGDDSVLEQYPLSSLANNNQLKAFKHNDFWRPMDTLRDKVYLDQLWNSGNAPWKVW
jgi:glucose-1-phosphate cytidylyltransferase